MVKREGVAGPRKLAVELVEVDGEELAVFTWEPEPTHRGSLTEAEQDVLRRVLAGESNAAIARGRKTSARTVANQVASLLRKLDASSRFDLIRRFGSSRAADR